MNPNYVSPWQTVLHLMTPIKPLFDLEGVTDIEIDNFQEIWIVQNGGRVKSDCRFDDETDVYALIRQIANSLALPPPTDKRAFLDARLPHDFPIDAARGARVSARIYPRSVYGSAINIRMFPPIHFTMDDLLRFGTVTESQVDFLRRQVEAGKSFGIVGGMGSGKSTMARALIHMIPEHRRLGLFEDTFELNIRRPKFAYVEVPQDEGDDMNTLMEKSLRMNLESVVLGEIRSGVAAYVFYRLMTVGIGNCMSTWHAASAKVAPTVLADLITEYRPRDRDKVAEELRSLLGGIIHLANRKVVEILEFP